MFSQIVAAERAQRQICHAMRGLPPDVRAGLPFDPHDAQDVLVWVTARIDQTDWSGDETVAYVVKKIVWDAQKTGRRRSIHSFGPGPLQRLGTGVGRDNRPGIDPWLDIPAPDCGPSENETAEEWLACAMAPVRAIAGPPCSSMRKAMAALSCLARVIHAVKACFSPLSVQWFVDALSVHTAFLKLPISEAKRVLFVDAMKRLETTGNFRHDLAKAGWSCPGQ